jgi:hypothetical protein
MKSNNPCITATVAEALERLPGPEGKRFATVFEHGSLLLKSMRRVASIRKSRTRETRSTSSRQAQANTSAVSDDRRLDQLTFCSLQPAACIASKTFPATSRLWVMFYGPEGGESNTD